MPKLIKHLIVIVLVVAEGGLLLSMVGENASKRKEIEKSCEQKCTYRQNSYMWEFSGENATRGFTTKDECNDYCIKFEQGFVYSSILSAKSFMGSLLNSVIK